jgi:hypothetical protein
MRDRLDSSGTRGLRLRINGPKFAEDRENKFRDGGMDVHGMLKYFVGNTGVHDVQNAVDRLAAAGCRLHSARRQ